MLMVRTDHEGLKWISNLAGPTGMLVRWKLLHFQFEFGVVHIAATKN